jgi:hypothetical protein
MAAKDIKETLAEISPEALLADGFDEALVGIARQFTNTLALYSYDKCVEILMRRDGMSHEGAIEFMEYNVVGAWVGQNTPAFTVT